MSDEPDANKWLYTFRSKTMVLPEETTNFLVSINSSITKELLSNAWIYFRNTDLLISQRYGPCSLPLPPDDIMEIELPIYEAVKQLFEQFMAHDTEERRNCALRLRFLLADSGSEMSLWRAPMSEVESGSSAFVWTYPTYRSDCGITYCQQAKMQSEVAFTARGLACATYECGYDTQEKLLEAFDQLVKKLLAGPTHIQKYEFKTLELMREALSRRLNPSFVP